MFGVLSLANRDYARGKLQLLTRGFLRAYSDDPDWKAESCDASRCGAAVRGSEYGRRVRVPEHGLHTQVDQPCRRQLALEIDALKQVAGTDLGAVWLDGSCDLGKHRCGIDRIGTHGRLTG